MRKKTASTVLLIVAILVGIVAALFGLTFIRDYLARKKQEQAEQTGQDFGNGLVGGILDFFFPGRDGKDVVDNVSKYTKIEENPDAE